MYKINVTIPSDTGLPEDSVVNTWCLLAAQELGAAALEDCVEEFANFYSQAITVGGNTFAVGQFLSPVLDATALACEITATWVPTAAMGGGVPLGSPDWTELFTLPAPINPSTPLPSETAFVLTLEGTGRAEAPVEAPGNIRPKQRRTGRVYLGPLNNNAIEVVSGVARPAFALGSIARGAVDRLHDQIETVSSLSATLGVWSRADAAAYEVTAVSTDNAFDTMRSRGESATARTRLAIT